MEIPILKPLTASPLFVRRTEKYEIYDNVIYDRPKMVITDCKERCVVTLMYFYHSMSGATPNDFWNASFNRIAAGMSLENMVCSRCKEGFTPHEKIVNSTGELWHPKCFV